MVAIAPHEVGRQRRLCRRELARQDPGLPGEPGVSRDGTATNGAGNSSFSSSAQPLVTQPGSAATRAGKAGGWLTRTNWILNISFFYKAGILQLNPQPEPLSWMLSTDSSHIISNHGAMSPHRMDFNGL